MHGWHAIAGFLIPSLVMPELIRLSDAVVQLPIPGMMEILWRVEEDNRLGNMRRGVNVGREFEERAFPAIIRLVCPPRPKLRNRDVLMALPLNGATADRW